MTDDDKLRDYLKRVTVDLHEAQQQLKEVDDRRNEPIAILGIGCRFPGGVRSPEQLWQLVRDGRDVIADWPTNRGWDTERLYDPDPEKIGTSYTREGGFLHDVDEFDASFFSISPREALAMDPQQRVLLEASWEAIESSGIKPGSLKGTQTGVFVGGALSGYGVGQAGSVSEEIAGHFGSGTLSSVLSGRIAYVLGLEGPGLTIDTACSSSLVALHVACNSLRAQESSMALVGGVGIFPTPTVFLELSRQRALAPDGRCKAFGEGADGVGWGEGVGVLLLERLSDARRHGHPVLTVIRGSAVNQDGASNGLTAPNGPAQQRVIHSALANANVLPHQIDVVEAHGTGTPLGDPIEAQALLGTYGQSRPDSRPLWLGSIKSNIGHTQAAAGVAGVIKMVMAMRHELLPKTLHADRPSSKVDWSTGSVSLLAEPQPWLKGSEPRRAAVSSFGISGTNAHVILEESTGYEPERIASQGDDGAGELVPGIPSQGGLLNNGFTPMCISARDEAGLRGQAASLSSFIESHPDLEVADIASALAQRSTFARRAVAIGRDRQELLETLGEIDEGKSDVGLICERGGPGPGGKVVFVFPGQGSQWSGMALELMDCSTVFAQRLNACSEELSPIVGWKVEDVLREADGAPELGRIEVLQPVLFAVMVALAGLWEACGVLPDAVVGHSQGEIVAAHVAGGLSLGDAARIVALRSQMLTTMVGHGGVASVALGVAQVQERLARWGERLTVSGVNGPRSVNVSGERDALAEFLKECAADDVRAREVPATVASHSPFVEHLRERVYEELSAIEPRTAEIPLYSTVTGELLDTARMDKEYWYRNLREPVAFASAVGALLGAGYRTFIEVSPHPVLTMGVHETVEGVSADQVAEDSESGNEEMQLTGAVAVLGSLRRAEGGSQRFLTSLAEAWVSGADVNWEAVLGANDAAGVELPTYAFQRRPFWLQSQGLAEASAMPGQESIEHPFVKAAIPLAESEGWLFTGRISLADQPWIVDHSAGGIALVPGTTFVDIALTVGTHVGCEVLLDLVFEETLWLSEIRTAARLQIVLDPPDEAGRRAIGLFARTDDADVAEIEEAWTRIARGAIAPASQAIPDGETPLERKASLAKANGWPPADAESLSVDDLYDYFAGVGLEYGPAFLTVGAAWQYGEEVLAEVSLPEEEIENARMFKIHPALLDSSMQACGVMLMAENPATPEYGTMPFAWTRVRVHMDGVSSVRARVARSDSGGYSLVAFDDQDRMVVSADAMVLRRVTPEKLQQLRGSNNLSLHRLDWVTVAPGDAQRDASQPYPDPQAAFEAVERGETPPEVAAVFLGLDEPPGGAEQLAASRELVERAVSLVQQWLSESRLQKTRLVILTRRAVSAKDRQGVLDLTSAPLWGLMRSVQSEHPGRFVLVDIDGVLPEPAVLAKALQTGEPQLALRDGEFLAPRLRRAAENRGVESTDRAGGSDGEEDPADRSPVKIGIHKSGVAGSVLITGGTGLIGGALAQHVVSEHGVRSVVLAARRGMEAPGAQELKHAIADLGAEVKIVACDVSDRRQVAGLLDSIPSEYPLTAVIHAAGALDDGVIESMTPEQIARVFEPKVDGAWHLHELTETLELSAFILCSAGAATIGSPGQSNYAAANAFLDGLAAYRCEVGLPGLSIAWGLWDGGLASDLTSSDQARLEQMGILALSVEEGLSLFDAAYAFGEPLMLPVRLSTPALRAKARIGMIPPLFTGLIRMPASGAAEGARKSLIRRLASTPESERQRVTLDLVRTEVAKVLGHSSADDIEPERAFSELGFDSLTAIEFRNRLIAASGVQLPATLAFDYPSSEALSKYLLEQVSHEVDGHVPRASGEIDVREAIASIPLERLREANLLDTLMALAGLAEDSSRALEEDPAEEADEMDLESLVRFSLGSDAQAGLSTQTVEDSA